MMIDEELRQRLRSLLQTPPVPVESELVVPAVAAAEDGDVQTEPARPVANDTAAMEQPQIGMFMQQPWFERDNDRLVLESAAMQKAGHRLFLYNFGGRLGWAGVIERGLTRAYRIGLIYPDTYPAEPPMVYLHHALPEYEAYLGPGGQMPLFAADQDLWNAEMLGVDVIMMAENWLRAMEKMLP